MSTVYNWSDFRKAGGAVQINICFVEFIYKVLLERSDSESRSQIHEVCLVKTMIKLYKFTFVSLNA